MSDFLDLSTLTQLLSDFDSSLNFDLPNFTDAELMADQIILSQNTSEGPYITCNSSEIHKQYTNFNNSILRSIPVLRRILDLLQQITTSMNSLNILLKHKHNCHFHGNYRHRSDNLSLNISDGVYFNRKPRASVESLNRELLSGQDLDGTGNVYAKTFLFTGNVPSLYADDPYRENIDLDGIHWVDWEQHEKDGISILYPNRIKFPKYGDNARPGDLDDITGSTDEDDPVKIAASDYINAVRTPQEMTKLLIKELASKTDADGNNQVYGKDFVFDGDFDLSNNTIKPNEDQFKHPLIIQKIVYTSKLPLKNIHNISWNHYLSTVGLGDYAVRVSDEYVPARSANELISILVDEFSNNLDMDGDGMVYGKDFLIIGDNTPIQLKNIIIPCTPDIIMTWNSYISYADYTFPPRTKFDYAAIILSDPNFGKVYAFNNNDPEVPPELKIHPQNDSKLIYLNWIDYVKSLGASPNVDYFGIGLEEYTVKLTTEFHNYFIKNLPPEDLDCNDLIYGRDFLISDFDVDKVDCLFQVESLGNFVLDKDPELFSRLRNAFTLPAGLSFNCNDEEYEEFWNEPKPQITSCCVPVEKQKKDFTFPKFTFIVTWNDYLSTIKCGIKLPY